MILLALVLVAAPSGPNLVGAAPVVTLLDRASTPGTRIRLGDVVHADGRAALTDELLTIDLGRAPSPGFQRRVTREDVRALLPTDTMFEGAMETLVRSDLTSLPSDRILDEARGFVRAHGNLVDGAELEVTRRPRDLRVPRGRSSLELVPRLRGNSRGRGPIQALVDVQVDGKLQATIPVAFMARVFREVPVLKHDLVRGARLTEVDLTTARLDLTRSAQLPLTDPSALLGRVARRRLRAGTPLAETDYQRPNLVIRNDPVTMVFSRGRLRAETYGIARETAGLGDTVRVENLTTKKIVVGRVIGPGLVQMHP